MRTVIRRAGAAAGALLAGIVLSLLGAQHAGAITPDDFCGNNGNGYCINAWNGGSLGHAVKMYYGNSSNEQFAVQQINRCAGSSLVTATCPSSNTALDQQLDHGGIVYQIVYLGNNLNLCVGSTDTSGGTADLVGCNDTSTGSGGGQGTVFMAPSLNAATLYNSFFSGHDDDFSCMTSGGNPGTPLYLNKNSGCTQWGYSSVPS